MSSSHALKIRLAPWALLSVSAAWGMAFVVMKDAIERQSVNNFLFTRFSLAVIVMVALKPQVLMKLDRDLIIRAGSAGIFLGLGYIFQTLGLARTGAAITGFVTGLYVVFTPLLAYFFLKERLTKLIWACVFIATIGLGLLSIRGFSVGIGEMLVLASAFFFAAHIIALGKWSSGRDIYAMTVVQLAVCALLSGLASIPEGYSAPPDSGVWAVVVFTAVICTAVAFVVQTWSQAHMTTTKVAVILTMEVVFAALFAIIFGGERLTLQATLGGLMVLTAMFMIVLKEE
ncbi:EamA-like transporter family protein [Candidatus Planktophila dulcis]|uniref:EamA-like transporter family protein n=1 Tax=Candidatus Planktophila dulcis TaxID=1884914 RepID=A0AAC9YTD5_9ACTN|nr:DMT family transporter [Candidatus Planktophila dulcis]ASY11874.1 EamA-like transporter family protein [Candidatus Planktophila dulcis]